MALTPPPDEASLRDAALTYLARFAATEAGLLRVLERRIERWRRTQLDPEAVTDPVAAAREVARKVVSGLVLGGMIDDAAFATSRAAGLARGGVSRRGIAAKLATKGITSRQIQATLATDDPETELAAAVVLARKRRLGPFRTAETADPAVRRREMGVLARAGFSRDFAVRVLAMDREEAEARILALRR